MKGTERKVALGSIIRSPSISLALFGLGNKFTQIISHTKRIGRNKNLVCKSH